MRTIIIGLIALQLGATTRTVCTSACTSQSINTVELASACGDTIQVKAGGGAGPGGAHLAGDGSVGNVPIALTHPCTPGNEIIITTDQAAKLPPAGTRITPAYADGASRVVPRIMQDTTLNHTVLTTTNGASHASGYKIIGIEFFCNGLTPNGGFPNGSPCIGIGATLSGASDATLNAISDLPTNITCDRCIVRQDPTLFSDCHPVMWDANGGSIINSWISVGLCHTQDTQGLLFASAQNVVVNNTYVAGGYEVVSTGAMSPIHDKKNLGGLEGVISSFTTVPNFSVTNSEISHEPWLYHLPWSANSVRIKGQEGNSATLGYCQFQVLVGGVTGSVEPNWASFLTPLTTFVDGTVTWITPSSACDGSKNLFESKGSSGVTLRFNSLHDAWYSPGSFGGSQEFAFTLTPRTDPSAGMGNASVLTNTTIENNVIRGVGTPINISAIDDFDPNFVATLYLGTLGPYAITASVNDTLSITTDLGSCTITLTAGAAQTAAQVLADINASSCNTKVAACSVADRVVIRRSNVGAGTTCASAVSLAGTGGAVSTIVENSVAHDAAATLGITEAVTHKACEQPTTGVVYGCGTNSGLIIRNNLFTDVNNTVPHAAEKPYAISVLWGAKSLDISHNTFDVYNTYTVAYPNGSYAAYFLFLDPTGSVTPFDAHITSNIFGVAIPGGSNYMTVNTENSLVAVPGGSLYYDFSAINYGMCQGLTNLTTLPDPNAWCSSTTDGIFSHNVLPGTSITGVKTLNSTPIGVGAGAGYPSTNYNDTFASMVFQDRVSFNLAPYSSYPTVNKFARGSYEGRQVGADVSQLPLINGLSITTSDRAAVFTFSVTAPAAPFNCVARVSTDPNMLSSINPIAPLADLDPFTFQNPEISDADWLPKGANTRSFIIGHNSALAASTVYQYHLSCGGAYATGSFTTSATRSGTASVSLGRTPAASMGAVANCLVEWGTAYSRSSGVISGGSSSNPACTAGTPLSSTIAGVTRGVPLYTRVTYRSSGNATLAADAVSVVVP